MDQVHRAEDRCVNKNQVEDRNDEMTRPVLLTRQSVSDERHQNSNDGNDRRGDVQPFSARDVLAAHDVRTDVENREQDRQVHSDGGQSCKPGQDSDRKRL